LIKLSNVYFLAFEYIPDSEITGLTGSEEDLLDRVSVIVVLEIATDGFSMLIFQMLIRKLF